MNTPTSGLILKPIGQYMNENLEYSGFPDCKESLQMTVDYFNKIGYNPPWIGYFAFSGDTPVGTAGFKGKPQNDQVEIAYGTFETARNQGIGTRMCRALIEVARKTDPTVRVTARTLPEKNYSTRILEKNGFELIGTVIDPEDGPVYEWILRE